MSLKEHVLELRRRVLVSLSGLAVAAIVGWYFYDPLFAAISAPLEQLARERGFQAGVNFAGVATPFDLRLQVSFFLGIIISSPLWIYQLWAFITPGLTAQERRYTLGFVGAAIPLFLAGIYSGWLIAPNIIYALTSFTPQGGSNFIQATEYLTFIMQLLLFMGLAFLVPVLLIGVNAAGIVRGRTMLRTWRVNILLVTVVSAMAVPGNDVFTMFLMAVPLLFLYFGSMAVCLFLDKQRDKRVARQQADTEAHADTATPFDRLPHQPDPGGV